MAPPGGPSHSVLRGWTNVGPGTAPGLSTSRHFPARTPSSQLPALRAQCLCPGPQSTSPLPWRRGRPDPDISRPLATFGPMRPPAFLRTLKVFRRAPPAEGGTVTGVCPGCSARAAARWRSSTRACPGSLALRPLQSGQPRRAQPASPPGVAGAEVPLRTCH